jgi:hypothetical protein
VSTTVSTTTAATAAPERGPRLPVPAPVLDPDPDRPHAAGLHEPYGASDLKPDPFE